MKRVRLLSTVILVALVVALVLALLPAQTVQAVEVCGLWDTVDVMGGEYIVMNNVWGAETAQCIDVPDTNQTTFTVTSAAHDQGSVASYPAIYKGCHWGACTTGWSPTRVSDVTTAPFSWSVNTISAGTWNVAAEAWFDADLDTTNGFDGGAELMIWLDYQGMQPAGSQVGTATIAGVTRGVWTAQIGWTYIAYRATSPMTSINADLKPFIDDSVARGYIDSSWYLHNLEAGFELMTGGAGFTSNSFSFSVNDGTPPPTSTPDIDPTPTPESTPGGTCSPATPKSLPFVQNGAGTFCWSFAAPPRFINSWVLTSPTRVGSAGPTTLVPRPTCTRQRCRGRTTGSTASTALSSTPPTIRQWTRCSCRTRT